ncbi:MAG: flagellar M-ring protein FliF [Oligoflexia bacterium]|nr:flagellar M-ring protein FliF [Oligoflexia bacterium]
MIEYLKRVFEQTAKFLKAQPPLKLAAAGVTAGGIVIGLVAMFLWAGRTTFAPLMTNLNPEDAANIMRVLREKRIPFQVDPTGRNVTVPPESVDILRLELATMGLPQSSVVGYELFDKQSLGTTSFVQKVNQKRALEGELMRTINTIRGVRRSRVHLATPQKSAFVEDQKKATASVVVDLEPGTQLNEKQVYGIGNLVSRAVEGMEIADVVIVDSNGKTLSKNAGDSLAAATASQLDYQQKVESDLEKRIEGILSKVVGEGHVAAKVTAEVDFSQVNETQTIYDPDGAAVLSVERRNDTMNHVRPGPVGAAGAASNLPGQQSGVPEVRSDTTKANEVVNNLVPQTVRRTTKPVGTVKRLSVAVLVDGKQVKAVGADGKAQAKVEAWPAEKLKEFEGLVASAVGVDRKRGDTLEIRNMEFTREDFDEAQKVLAEKERKSYLQNMVIYALIGLAIGLFFLFVVRPFIKWITENTVESVDTFLPQTIEELERLQKNSNLPGLEEVVPVLPEKMDPEKVEGEMIKEKIVTLVDANPHKAALILKDWLHADAKKKAEKDKNEEGGGGKGKPASA